MTPWEATRILHLRSSAPISEIKAAFRRHAKKYHPDSGDSPSAEEFGKAVEAYDVMARYRNAEASWDLTANRGSKFMLPDIRIGLSIALADAFSGAEKSVSYQRRVLCGFCRGKGVHEAPGSPCAVCGATGQVNGVVPGTKMCCFSCMGTGHSTSDCHDCSGRGWVEHQVQALVQVPPRTENGALLTMQALGNQNPDGSFGDLHVMVQYPRVAADGKTEVMNDGTLLVSLEAPWSDALTGKEVDASPLAGIGGLKIRLSHSNKSGHMYVVSGMGMKRGMPALIKVFYTLPSNMSEEDAKSIGEALKKYGDPGSKP